MRNYELEADLYKVPMPRFFRREMGELERTSYEDGEERLKISVRSVEAPDGTEVDVVIDGTTIASVPVAGGRGRLVLSSTDGHQVPEVAAGQQVEIHFRGRAVLAGTFKLD